MLDLRSLEVLLMRFVRKLRTISSALARYTSELGVGMEGCRRRCLPRRSCLRLHLLAGTLFSKRMLSLLLSLLSLERLRLHREPIQRPKTLDDLKS